MKFLILRSSSVSMSKSIVLFSLFMLLGLRSIAAFARFHERDAQQIDADDNQNTETWNDKNSYRWPLSWQRRWDHSQSGFRISAGSLNMTRFSYLEDIRIDPIPREDVSIAFEQHRDEDYVEAQESQEVRLGLKLIDPVRLLVLGDTSSLKEYGDLGMGLRLLESETHFTDLYYWSVDHYYNEKTHEDGAYRGDATKTWGVRSVRLAPPHEFGWQIFAERDLPFSWYRPATGAYNYERTKFSGRIDWRQDALRSWYLSEQMDRKAEGYTILPLPTASLNLRRDASVSELGYEYFDGDQNGWTIAVQSIVRTSTWTKSGGDASQNRWTERIPPDTSVRKEWGIYGTQEFPIAPRTVFVHGIYVNDAVVTEDQSRWQELEVKYQTELVWNLARNSGFGLNATWDLDQMVRDYPYRARSFRPWGGGNIIAQVAF